LDNDKDKLNDKRVNYAAVFSCFDELAENPVLEIEVNSC